MLNVELPDEGFARPQATLSRKRERALSTSSTAIGTAAATRGERYATLQRLTTTATSRTQSGRGSVAR